MDRFTLVVIASHCGENGQAWPSIATLASEMGCSVATVKRSLRRLRDLGELEVRRRPNASNVYRITLGGERTGELPGERTGELPGGIKSDAGQLKSGGSDSSPVSRELQEPPISNSSASPSEAALTAADDGRRWSELSDVERNEWLLEVCSECDVDLHEVLTPKQLETYRRAAATLWDGDVTVDEIADRVDAARCQWGDFRFPSPQQLVARWAELKPLPESDERILALRRHEASIDDPYAATAPLTAFLPGGRYGALVATA